MKTMSRGRIHRGQGGFSLIEVLIALVIAGGVSATIFAAIHMSRSKGEILFNEMSAVADGAKQFAVDTGCYPYVTGELFSTSILNSNPTNNSCGVNVVAGYRGPYGDSKPTDSSGDIQVPQAGVSTYLTIKNVGTMIPGGATTQYAVEADSVPTEVATQAFKTCVGAGTITTSGSNQIGGSCYLSSSSGGVSNFGYVFAGH